MRINDIAVRHTTKTYDTIKKFKYILNLQFPFVNKGTLGNSYQYTAFVKDREGKWYLDYTPLATEKDLLTTLETYKREKTQFRLNLQFTEDIECVEYNVRFVDYSFSMDYEKDDPVKICFVLEEI